jgi:hypothetical protein
MSALSRQSLFCNETVGAQASYMLVSRSGVACLSIPTL